MGIDGKRTTAQRSRGAEIAAPNNLGNAVCGGLLAAAIPVADKFFDDDTSCAAAYRSVDAIRRVEEVSPEFGASYVRPMQRQLKIAEKCGREAEQ